MVFTYLKEKIPLSCLHNPMIHSTLHQITIGTHIYFLFSIAILTKTGQSSFFFYYYFYFIKSFSLFIIRKSQHIVYEKRLYILQRQLCIITTHVPSHPKGSILRILLLLYNNNITVNWFFDDPKCPCISLIMK